MKKIFLNIINDKLKKKGFAVIEIVILVTILIVSSAVMLPSFLETANSAEENAEQFTNYLIDGIELPDGSIIIEGDGESVVRPPDDTIIVDPPTPNPDEGEPDEGGVQKVDVTPKSVQIFVGDTHALSYSIAPADALNQKVSWSSNSQGIASVNQAGTVTGIAPGNTQVCAYSMDNGRYGCSIITVVGIEATDIVVDPIALLLKTGETVKIKTTVIPDNVTDKSVTYISENTAIAVVDKDGNVTAADEVTNKNNKTNIIVRSGNISKSINVEVIGDIVPTTEVLLDPKEKVIGVGDKYKPVAKVLPDTATDKDLHWESNNEKVATVNQFGEITGVSEGSAIITVKNYGKDFYGSEFVSNSMLIRVIPAVIHPDSIVLRYESNSITVGDQMTSIVIISPDSVTEPNVSYRVSDESVLNVDSEGKVTAVGVGSATVAVWMNSDPNISATFEIKSNGKPINVNDVNITNKPVNGDPIELELGDNFLLRTEIIPSNASNKGLIWYTSDNKIVSIDQNGNLRANNYGTVIVTVKSIDGGMTDTVQINVPYYPVTDLVVNPTRVNMVVSDKVNISSTIKPNNASDKKIKYKSSDTSVAIVSGNTIEAVGNGTASITVSSADGKTATILVQVADVIPDVINASPKSISLKQAESKDIVISVLPENSANKNYVIDSSDDGIASITKLSNGNIRVKGLLPGVTSFTVKASANSFARTTIVVEVKPIMPSGLSASPKTLKLEPGQSGKITASVSPYNTFDKGYYCELVSNEGSIVSIMGNSETGGCTVSAINTGTTVINVVSSADNTKRDTVAVSVVDQLIPVTGITTTDNLNVFLKRSETFQTNVVVNPSNASHKDIYYSSYNQTIATVNSSGLITGVSAGEVIIEAQSVYGDYRVEYKVTVAPVYPTNIIVNPSEIYLLKGDTKTFSLSTTPKGHDYFPVSVGISGDVENFELDIVTGTEYDDSGNELPPRDSTIKSIGNTDPLKDGGKIEIIFDITTGVDKVASDSIKVEVLMPVCKWSNWEPLDSIIGRDIVSWGIELDANRGYNRPIQDQSLAKLVYEKSPDGAMIRYRAVDSKCWGAWGDWTIYRDSMKPGIEADMESGTKDCNVRPGTESLWTDWSAWETTKKNDQFNREIDEKNQYQTNSLALKPFYKNRTIVGWKPWQDKIESSLSHQQTKKQYRESVLSKGEYENVSNVNLLLNPSFSEYTGNYNPGWNTNINGTLKPTMGWTSGYNGGVNNPSTVYHAHLNESKFGYPTMNYNSTSYSGWQGVTQNVSQVTPGHKYLIVINMWSDKAGGVIRPGIYHKPTGAANYTFSDAIVSFTSEKANTWETHSAIVEMPASLEDGSSKSLYIYGHYGTPSDKYVNFIGLYDLGLVGQ